MKKFSTWILVWLLMWSFALPVCAEQGNVIYDGNAQEFIFAPGSDYSPTDLFPEFKDVMPGDCLVQDIVVKNTASQDVDVKIYMRALGAHEDSKSFLSQLYLRVDKKEEQGAVTVFDGNASEKAQLTDWVCLGSFSSGSEVVLQVTLEVPVELDNTYSSQIGKLDWEFKVEEFPVEEDEPQIPGEQGDQKDSVITTPPTGDVLYEAWQSSVLCCVVSLAVGMLWMVLHMNEKRKNEVSGRERLE